MPEQKHHWNKKLTFLDISNRNVLIEKRHTTKLNRNFTSGVYFRFHFLPTMRNINFFSPSYPEMTYSNKLMQTRIENILGRLKSNIAQSSRLINDINTDLEDMIEQNRKTVEMCDIYKIWISKAQN